MSEEHTDHAEHEPHSHTKLYIMVFLGLMVGTFLTVAATQVDFGMFNIVVALGIAIAKASLVLWYFMHLNESPNLIKFTAVMGFLGVITMLAFLIADLATRSWIETPGAWSALGW